MGGSTPSPAPGPAVTAPPVPLVPPVPPDFIAAAHAAAAALRQFADKAHTFQDTRIKQANQMLSAPGDWKGAYATKYISDSLSQRGALSAAAESAAGYATQLGMA